MTAEPGTEPTTAPSDTAATSNANTVSGGDAEPEQNRPAAEGPGAGGDRGHQTDDEPSPADRLRAEKEHLTDVLARTQAEFANYRKRIARDQGQLQDRARATVLEAFVPALDALDAAVHHDDTMISPLRKIIADTTERLGLERFEPPSGEPFDPEVHDAVSGPTDADRGRLVIRSVLRPGYRLGSKLLRAAEVTVDTPDPGEPDENTVDAHDAGGSAEPTGADRYDSE